MYKAYFHDGSMEGDCQEASLPIESPDISWSELKSRLLTPEGANHNWHITHPEDVEDFIECSDDLVGAWIVDESTEKKFREAMKCMYYPGNDSAAYAQQAVWKGLYRAFSIKSVGQQAS